MSAQKPPEGENKPPSFPDNDPSRREEPQPDVVAHQKRSVNETEPANEGRPIKPQPNLGNSRTPTPNPSFGEGEDDYNKCAGGTTKKESRGVRPKASQELPKTHTAEYYHHTSSDKRAAFQTWNNPDAEARTKCKNDIHANQIRTVIERRLKTEDNSATINAKKCRHSRALSPCTVPFNYVRTRKQICQLLPAIDYQGQGDSSKSANFYF